MCMVTAIMIVCGNANVKCDYLVVKLIQKLKIETDCDKVHSGRDKKNECKINITDDAIRTVITSLERHARMVAEQR